MSVYICKSYKLFLNEVSGLKNIAVILIIK